MKAEVNPIIEICTVYKIYFQDHVHNSVHAMKFHDLINFYDTIMTCKKLSTIKYSYKIL